MTYRARFEQLGFAVGARSHKTPAGPRYRATLAATEKRGGDYSVDLSSGEWSHSGTMLQDRPFAELAHYVGRPDLAPADDPPPLVLMTSPRSAASPKAATVDRDRTPPKAAALERTAPATAAGKGGSDVGKVLDRPTPQTAAASAPRILPPNPAAPPGQTPQYVTRKEIPLMGGPIPAETRLFLTQLHPPRTAKSPKQFVCERDGDKPRLVNAFFWYQPDDVPVGARGNFRTTDGRTVCDYPLDQLEPFKAS